jgi:hypothetical protein
MTINPFIPCSMKPTTSGNGDPSLSMTALSNTPPLSTQMPSPAIAKTISIACTATSAATA